MQLNQKRKSTWVDLAIWLVVGGCVAGMVYGIYAHYQHLDQRDLPAADAAVAEAAKASPCIAARMRNDRIDRGQPVTNGDLSEIRSDCNALAAAQLERVRRTEAAQRQAKALQ